MSERSELQPDEYLAVEAAVAADELHDAIASPTSHTEGPDALRSAIWTVAGFAVMRLFQFGFNIPLTRLLNQWVYGVMTLLDMFVIGLHMFSDLGVRQCVVNSERGDEPRFLNMAWTVQVSRGLFLWALTGVLGWPLAWYYGIPQMTWLLPLVGFAAVLDGFTSTSTMTMSRRLRRDRLVIREVAAYGLSMTFVVIWLYILHRRHLGDSPDSTSQLLAFSFGRILSNAIEMALSYTLIRGAMNRFEWDRTAARELMHFGGWIFVSTACTYLAANLDRLCIGKINLAMLADYQLAATFARVPTQLLALIGHQVLFPLYSRIRLQKQSFDEVFALVSSAVNGAAAYLAAGTIAACPTLIWLVYDDRYLPAGEFVRWLSLAAWFTVLQTSYEVVLLSMGRTKQIATGQFVKLVCVVPLLLGGYYFQGIVGVIAGYTIAEIARYIVLFSAVARAGLWVIRIDILLTALILISVGVTNLVGPRIATSNDSASQLGIRLLVEIAMISAFWGFILAFWWPRHGRRIIELLWRGK